LKLLPRDASHVFEFRYNSWFDNEVLKLLRHYNVGFCIYDMPGFSTPVIATSDFVYIHFHGSQWLYGGSYSDKELEDWARRIGALKASAVYAYFNNDAEESAIKNALMLKDLLANFVL
ncbi:MAG: DUF72 domain-containing protein, partial [Chloroflexota bacterium]